LLDKYEQNEIVLYKGASRCRKSSLWILWRKAGKEEYGRKDLRKRSCNHGENGS
jgi:hypothetical protein